MDRLLRNGNVINITKNMWVFSNSVKRVMSGPNDIIIGNRYARGLGFNYPYDIFDSNILLGEYEVIATEIKPSGKPGLPDGYFVTCRKIGKKTDDDDISFFQTKGWKALVEPRKIKLVR